MGRVGLVESLCEWSGWNLTKWMGDGWQLPARMHEQCERTLRRSQGKLRIPTLGVRMILRRSILGIRLPGACKKDGGASLADCATCEQK